LRDEDAVEIPRFQLVLPLRRSGVEQGAKGDQVTAEKSHGVGEVEGRRSKATAAGERPVFKKERDVIAEDRERRGTPTQRQAQLRNGTWRAISRRQQNIHGFGSIPDGGSLSAVRSR
jgi:hypothetical protein